MEPHIRAAIVRAASAESVDTLTRWVCESLAGHPVALVRVWVVRDSSELRLAASAGLPMGGGSYHRLDGEFSRLSIGVGKIGQIASTCTDLVIRDIRGDEEWLSNPSWIARQGIRSFAGFPLQAGDGLLGVIATFLRSTLTVEMVSDLRFLADVTAARMCALNARPDGVAPAMRASAGLCTRSGLREFERRSIEAALLQCNGRVFGINGAAALLQMKPTTLASRIKALGIRVRQ